MNAQQLKGIMHTKLAAETLSELTKFYLFKSMTLKIAGEVVRKGPIGVNG